jgi:hypothetical protein
MNYTRRPNRPDANVYRQMRRQSLGGSSRSDARRGRRGSGARSIFLLVLILACAGAAAWMLLK